jgi:hypothetical protein
MPTFHPHVQVYMKSDLYYSEFVKLENEGNYSKRKIVF